MAIMVKTTKIIKAVVQGCDRQNTKTDKHCRSDQNYQCKLPKGPKLPKCQNLQNVKTTQNLQKMKN